MIIVPLWVGLIIGAIALAIWLAETPRRLQRQKDAWTEKAGRATIRAQPRGSAPVATCSGRATLGHEVSRTLPKTTSTSRRDPSQTTDWAWTPKTSPSRVCNSRASRTLDRVRHGRCRDHLAGREQRVAETAPVHVCGDTGDQWCEDRLRGIPLIHYALIRRSTQKAPRKPRSRPVCGGEMVHAG